MTTFRVSDFVGVLRGLAKTNADVIRIKFDFSKWLTSDELITGADSFNYSVTPPDSGTWQLVPYTSPPPSPPVDTTPLGLLGISISADGKHLDNWFSGGTPGVGYLVAFVVSTNGFRKKALNIFVDVKDIDMGLAPVTPIEASTTVTQTTVLPTGTLGNVFVANGTSAPITVTLPATSTVGWSINAIDVLGNAHTNNITWQGAGGALIIGEPTFVFNQDYESVTFTWNGTGWSIE